LIVSGSTIEGMDRRRLIGRTAELQRVDAFLGAMAGGPAALILVGEAGIGKTTIWREAVARARREFMVLESQPSEQEQKLSFAGLGDLLRDLGEDVWAGLPPPQRYALDVALVVEEPGPGGPDRRTVAAGLLTLVCRAAEIGPVLVAVDDGQWLDLPTTRALAFALRRLRHEPVGLLLSVRSGPGGAAAELCEAAAVHRVDLVEVPPLGPGEIRQIVLGQTGRVVAARDLNRVVGVTGGNPFLAEEIAEFLQRHGSAPLGDPLPLPKTVTGLLGERIGALRAGARPVLLAAAVAAAPEVRRIAKALGTDGRAVEVALSDAVRAGLVSIRHDTIKFAHPLIPAVVLARAAPHEVRRAHRLLAATFENGGEMRARHLALGAESADQTIAGELDAASGGAASRGAPESAAELAELAARLTPPGQHGLFWQRKLRAAEHHLSAGDLAAARRLAEDAAGAGGSTVRARARLLLAELAWLDNNSVAAAALGERALADAAGSAPIELEAHARLAYLYRHDRRRGLAHATRAGELLDVVGPADARLRARALFGTVYNEVDLGLPLRRDVAEQALAFEARCPPARICDRVSFLLGVALVQVDDLDGARRLLERALMDAHERGDEGSLPMIHDQLFILDWLQGRWDSAGEHAAAQVRLATQAGQEVERIWGLESMALLHAHKGSLDEARRLSAAALEAAARIDDEWSVAYIQRTVGFIALSQGDSAAADAAFRVADQIAKKEGLLSLGAIRHHADHIEAVVELGDLRRARALCGRLTRRAQLAGSPWGQAAGLRSSALLAAARGDLAGAAAQADQAVAAHEAVPIPFELARALLAQGAIRRRSKQKRAARASLQRAAGIFGELGAAGWARRAEGQLARVGVRPPATRDLTEAETQAIALVRQGLTNKEVASRLFISEKTVEGTLTRAYRKLGVRRRAELLASPATQPQLERDIPLSTRPPPP
jgi:DNA-binding CsgD family transcriptional regulator